MAHKYEKILSLLAQGLAPMQVVSIVGCSPAKLKAILEDEDFKKELEERKNEYLVEVKEEQIVNNKYLALEHKILAQIEANIPAADMKESVRALEVVSNRQDRMAKRASPITNGNTNTHNTFVTINMPVHALPEYHLNSSNEIIATEKIVDGKKELVSMSPMAGHKVKELFAARKQSAGNTIESLSPIAIEIEKAEIEERSRY